MRKSRSVLAVAGVVVCVALAFFPCLKSAFFNWDDGDYVVSNHALGLPAPAAVSAAFGSFFVGNYQPLTILSLSLDHWLFGLAPFGYHLTNLLLHLANVLLVLWLFRRLTGNMFVASATALFFGLHPLRVEAVAWISCRKELLYTAFFLGGLVVYVGYLKKGGARRYLFTLLLFFCALLSKATAVIFPLVMFVFDYWEGRKPGRRALAEKLPFFILSLAFGSVSVFAQSAAGAIRSDAAGLLVKAGVAAASIFFYFSKLFVPLGLSCAYPRFSMEGWLMAVSVGSLALFICLVVLTGRFTKKIFFGFFFFLVCLIPVLQFVPLGSTMAADRYTYLPSVGIAFIAATGFARLRNLRYLAFCCLLIIAVLSWDRCLAWKDSVTLWSREIRDRPRNATAYFGRGSAYLGLREFEKAYVDLKTSLYLAPGYKEVYLKLASVYAALGKKDDTVWSLKRYLAAFPEDAVARTWLEAIDRPGKEDVQYRKEDAK